MINGVMPVIGIPIYNRVDLLLRCIRSIDFPVALLVIVNNGGLPMKELHDPVFKEFSSHDDICDLQIFDPDGVEPRQDASVGGQDAHPTRETNIGVAGAWNYLLYNHCDGYVLLCNNDIQWAPGDLEKMHACVRLNDQLDAVFGNFSYSNFLITRKGRDSLGYFDENFWPAYLEDGDHWRRIVLSQAKICHAVGVNAIHGEQRPEEGGRMGGSCTIHSDPEIAKLNGLTHAKNWEYYRRKWGFTDETVRETFKHPFDRPGGDLNYWELSPPRLVQPHYFKASTEANPQRSTEAKT